MALRRTGISRVVGMRLNLKEEEEEENVELIVGRLKHLEGVVFREQQRQQQRQGYARIPITNFEGVVLTKGDANVQDENVDAEKGAVEEDEKKMGKRKPFCLVAEALTTSFYDCNICLNKAKDPVLTCCGHLFCWPCFYDLSYVDAIADADADSDANANANAKECPVCLGEVFERDLIPVYGNASVDCGDRLEMKETGSRIPPRPSAARIESIRQQLRSRFATTQEDMDDFDDIVVLDRSMEIPRFSNVGGGGFFVLDPPPRQETFLLDGPPQETDP